jgi:hypothetical protein
MQQWLGAERFGDVSTSRRAACQHKYITQPVTPAAVGEHALLKQHTTGKKQAAQSAALHPLRTAGHPASAVGPWSQLLTPAGRGACTAQAAFHGQDAACTLCSTAPALCAAGHPASAVCPWFPQATPSAEESTQWPRKPHTRYLKTVLWLRATHRLTRHPCNAHATASAAELGVD